MNLIIYLIGSASTQTFISSYNGYMAALNPSIPDFYHYVMNTVNGAGVNTHYVFDWGATFGLATVASVSCFQYAWMATVNAGELKNAELALEAIADGSGSGFWHGDGAHRIRLPTHSRLRFRYCISHCILQWHSDIPNFAVHHIVRDDVTSYSYIHYHSGTFLCAYQVCYQQFIIGTRVMLAQSFDRLLPQALSNVSAKRHTPVNAHLLYLAIGLVSTYIYFYVPGMWFATVSLWVPLTVGIGFTMVSGIVFPFVQKEMFDVSAASKYKIGKLPVIVITGLLGLGFTLWCLYNMFTVPNLGVVPTPPWPLETRGSSVCSGSSPVRRQLLLSKTTWNRHWFGIQRNPTRISSSDTYYEHTPRAVERSINVCLRYRLVLLGCKLLVIDEGIRRMPYDPCLHVSVNRRHTL